MNVLMVTAYPPVLHRHGGGVRMYHNIRSLAEKHDVHVVSFVDDDEDRTLLETVRPLCASILGVRRIPDFRPHWLSLAPFTVREFSTPAMHLIVDGMLRAKKIDVLQCEYLQMAQFYRKRVVCVLTAHEALSKNAHAAYREERRPVERVRLFYRWMQMLRYEIGQIGRFDRAVAVTAEDAAYFRSYAPRARLRVIPIGIDPEEFSPPPHRAADDVSVLFVGNYLHAPNLGAARFLAERLAPRFPHVRFVIAGAPRPADVHAPANVEFPGHVPDVRPYHRGEATIVVAPLFSGTGQRVKLLEAFAMECPVITTRVGAMGFSIEQGVQALLADTEDEFAAALQRLLADPALRRQIGQRGRAMILDRFSWSRIGPEFRNVVEEAAAAR